MYQKIIMLILSGFLLSSCSDNVRGYFKKSANNKWIDSKGFEGGKRKPLYNDKYITLAKRNIVNGESEEDDENYEDDQDSAGIYQPSPSNYNRQMYMEMIKHDSENSKKKKGKRFGDHRSSFIPNYREDEKYPSLSEVSKKIANNDDSDTQNLQQELVQIKSMLKDAKKDLVRYKCPMEPSNNIQEVKTQNNNNSHPSIIEAKHTKIVDEVAVQEKSATESENNKQETENKSLIEHDDELSNISQPSSI